MQTSNWWIRHPGLVHTKSWLINTVHYSLAKNNQEEKREGGLKESGAHYFSSPERHAGGGGGGAYLRGGASSRIYGSGIREWRNKSSQSQIQTSVRIFYRGRNFKPYLTGQQAPV